jgi:pyrimidine operon attenuation protein/uracil phosphoribosyltransferase
MKKEILNREDIGRALSRMAYEIVERNKGTRDLCIVGIHRGGVHLARRLSERIADIEGTQPPAASLDISFYRDDINMRKGRPAVHTTDIPFDINDKRIILVDDVIFTGRTIRAALDALMDFGRPAQIQLAVLIDRGHRELPIRADYAGKNVPTARTDAVKVFLVEEGGDDSVALIKEDAK